MTRKKSVPDGSGRPRSTADPQGPFRSADVLAVFQPIERLRTGEIVGFEALARLKDGETLRMPAIFLPALSEEDLSELFFTMLGQAVEAAQAFARPSYEPYVSVNVEPAELVRDGFLERFRSQLDRHRYGGGNRLVLELLEGDGVHSNELLIERLLAVRAMGVAIALDDIGSAYASLIRLRDLPVDIVKLDQSFSRQLSSRPEDLQFTTSLNSLAQALGKDMVAEGVETSDIHDALRVLGVEFGQGYGIARPMPLEAVGPWMAGRILEKPDRAPMSLLGAYAGHLKVVETCRVLMAQPLPLTWREESKDPHACAIGRYFDRNGLHATHYGMAHKEFHKVMALYDVDRPRWEAGATSFREALAKEILGQHTTA